PPPPPAETPRLRTPSPTRSMTETRVQSSSPPPGPVDEDEEIVHESDVDVELPVDPQLDSLVKKAVNRMSMGFLCSSPVAEETVEKKGEQVAIAERIITPATVVTKLEHSHVEGELEKVESEEGGKNILKG